MPPNPIQQCAGNLIAARNLGRHGGGFWGASHIGAVTGPRGTATGTGKPRSLTPAFRPTSAWRAIRALEWPLLKRQDKGLGVRGRTFRLDAIRVPSTGALRARQDSTIAVGANSATRGKHVKPEDTTGRGRASGNVVAKCSFGRDARTGCEIAAGQQEPLRGLPHRPGHPCIVRPASGGPTVQMVIWLGEFACSTDGIHPPRRKSFCRE
jgi:hypothetical protein